MNSRLKSRRSMIGFTMVEVLVTLGIFTIAIGMLIPMYSGVQTVQLTSRQLDVAYENIDTKFEQLGTASQIELVALGTNPISFTNELSGDLGGDKSASMTLSTVSEYSGVFKVDITLTYTSPYGGQTIESTRYIYPTS